MNRMMMRNYEDTGLNQEDVEKIKLAVIGKSIAEIKEFEGISIYHLKKLAKYEKEDRIIILPLKVGQEVFYLGEESMSEICPAMVFEIKIYTPHCPIWLKIKYISQTIGKQEYFCQETMIGKTIFLTYEGAKTELEKRSKVDNETD